MLSGFKQVPFNNIDSLNREIKEDTAAIMIETIQGEGGVRPTPLNFLEKIKNICIKNNVLLFLDEVQSGFGRSGKLFAYQWSNIEPDIMAVAKGIGSGFPMGACLASNKCSSGMIKGTHGSTFGGNHLAIAIGKAVIGEILKKGFLEKVNVVSQILWNELQLIKKDFDEILEVRGAGLLLGIKTKSNNIEIKKLLESRGLLTLTAEDNMIRLAPPLIINEEDVKKAIEIIRETLKYV